jgi:acetoacetyl-CoA reductase
MSKVAIVTGGTRGIGRAISIALRDEGYTVAANYGGNDEAAEAFKSETGIAVFKWNVGVFAECEKGVAAVVEALGSVEVLVNNAGITRDGMLHKLTPEAWDEVIRVDLTSVFNMSRLVIDGMRESSYGRIISISSINGQKGQMGQTNYSAAKAGILGFTKSLAREIGSRNITVNAVAPGFIDTDMTRELEEEQKSALISQIPLNRLGDPIDIANAVVFLAGPDASYITGETLHVNGGMYMS